MRISFATMFAAPGEVPEDLCYADKCERNFEFVHSLIKRAQKNGELDRRFDSRELAFGFYGLAHFYLVAQRRRAGFRAGPVDGEADCGTVSGRRRPENGKDQGASREKKMKRKLFIGIIIVVMAGGSLARVKALQINNAHRRAAS